MRSFSINVDLPDGRRGVRWTGNSPDATAAEVEALRALHMCRRAITYVRGGDPDALQPIQTSITTSEVAEIISGRIDWGVGQRLMTLDVAKVKGRRKLTGNDVRAMIEAAFAPLVHRALATPGYTSACVSLSTGYAAGRDHVFNVSAGGLIIGSPRTWGAGQRNDPEATLRAMALCCAHAAQNDKPRSTSRSIDVRFKPAQSATLSAASQRFKVDEASVAARRTLFAITGIKGSCEP